MNKTKNYMLLSFTCEGFDDGISEPEYFETHKEAYDTMYTYFQQLIGGEDNVIIDFAKMKEVVALGKTFCCNGGEPYDATKDPEECEIVINKNRCRVELDVGWREEFKIVKVGV